MKTTTKIVFASAFTLSAIAPTFVHAAYLQNARSNPCDERACAKCNGQECSCGPRAQLHGLCTSRRRRQVLTRLWNSQPALDDP